MRNLITIGDYCSDDLVTQELRSVVIGHLTTPLASSITFVNSLPHTIHTAFLLRQILNTEIRHGNPQNTVIFVNTDPRLQTSEGVEKAQGAQFYVIRLKCGAWVMGPSARFSFSMIKNDIEKVYFYDREFDKGTQFRSRELYMPVAALLMEEKEDEMALEEARVADIPDLEGFHVGHIDNYGNMKTTIPNSYMKGKFKYGDKVTVSVGNTEHEAYYVSNMFGKEPDVLVIAPGSSGMPDDPYLELIVWQHMPLSSAKLFFPHALPGKEVKIK